MKIYCLIFEGSPMDNMTRDLLYFAACRLLRNGKKRAKFKDELAEGEVRTENRRRVIGTLSGIEFNAIIENKAGKHSCRYFVRDSELLNENTVIAHGGLSWGYGEDEDNEGEEWKKA